MPFFSAKGQQWIFSRTGEWSPIQKLSDLGTRNQLPSLVVQARPAQDACELLKCMPDRAVVESILNNFQSSLFGLIFPIIDNVLFRYTLDMAYAPADGQETPVHVSAKACVLAFMSFVGLTRTACTVDMNVNPDACAMTATHLLADVFEDASVMSLQTVFMLVCGPIPHVHSFDLTIGVFLATAPISDLLWSSTNSHDAACCGLSKSRAAWRAPLCP